MPPGRESTVGRKFSATPYYSQRAEEYFLQIRSFCNLSLWTYWPEPDGRTDGQTASFRNRATGMTVQQISESVQVLLQDVVDITYYTNTMYIMYSQI